MMADFARRALDLKTPEGDKKAFEMFSKMVECGYKLCLPELGIMYFAGRGTKRDYKKVLSRAPGGRTQLAQGSAASGTPSKIS